MARGRRASTRANFRRRRSRNSVAIPFLASLTLGTLTNGSVVAVDTLGANLDEDLFAVSIDCQVGLHDLTPGEGPLEVGFAHSDLSVTEIAEALDASVLSPAGDTIARERARRPVRKMGNFSSVAESAVIGEGQPHRTTLKFLIGDGFSLDFWAINRSGGTLTTGAIMKISGTIFGNWRI